MLRPPVEIPGTGEAAASPGVSPDVYIVSGWGSDGTRGAVKEQVINVGNPGVYLFYRLMLRNMSPPLGTLVNS